MYFRDSIKSLITTLNLSFSFLFLTASSEQFHNLQHKNSLAVDGNRNLKKKTSKSSYYQICSTKYLNQSNHGINKAEYIFHSFDSRTDTLNE